MSSQSIILQSVSVANNATVKLGAPARLTVQSHPLGEFEIPIGYQPVPGQRIPLKIPEAQWKALLAEREEREAKTYARFVGRRIAWHIEYWRRRRRANESVASLLEYVVFNQPNLFPKRYLVAPRYYKATLKYVEALLVQMAQKRRDEDRLRMEIRRQGR